MRIALTIEYFDPSKGGGETYVRNFAHGLVEAGHEVHIFTNEWDPSLKSFIFHRVPRTPMKLFRLYAFARRAAAMVQEEQPPFDIVHGFGKSVYMDVFRPGGGAHRMWMQQELKAVGPGLKRFMTRVRQIFSIAQHLVLKLEAEEFRADGPHVIANSKMVRENILRFYPASPDRIRVIYNGVDLERFHPRNRERHRDTMRRELGLTGEVVLLFVGHNFKRKGLRPLIHALPLLRGASPPVRLMVLGGGRQTRYGGLVKKFGCGDMMSYLGARGDSERIYAAADVMVFPTYYDPCANVVLEAMASGLPVVTSIYNGSGELITPGREGYVVDPDDVQALVGAIRALLPSDVRTEAGRAARARIEAFPLSRNLREILDYYEVILAEKRSRRAACSADDEKERS